MSDYNDYSRVNKFEKRRKSTKSLSFFLVLGSILLVLLIALIIFGGDEESDQPSEKQAVESASESEQGEDAKDDTTSEEDKQSNTENNGTNNEDSASDSSTDTDTAEENNNDGTQTEQVEPSDDNVVEAYTKDWQPVGTEQSEPHSTNYDDESQDRLEMRKAAASATGVDEDSLTMWWIKRNGDQKVVTTVSNPENTEVYRAYLTWVEGQGWKPTKVEKLKENDQSYRFE